MSTRKLVVLSLIALLVLSALYVRAMARKREVLVSAGSRPDAPQYGVRGPHEVGARDLLIEGEAPLSISVWYPALNADSHEKATKYRYEIKMGAPLGDVAIATYAGEATGDAPFYRSTSPYPLVILSPGFSMGGGAYAWLAEHLASHGFVVIAPEHKEHLDPANELWRSAVVRPQDILTVLAYVDEAVASGGPLEELIIPDLVAVIGHSYGGYTALAAAGARIDTDSFQAQCESAIEAGDPAAWLCEDLLPHLADMAALAGLDPVPETLWPAWADPRVDAVVSMAGDAFFFGESGLAEISVPLMAMGGTADGDTPYMWGTHPTYEYASSPTKVRIAFEDAEHMIFTGPCESIPWYTRMLSGEFCSDATWDRHHAHDLIKHFATAFLRAELQQDRDAAAALTPDAVHFSNLTYEAQGY